MLTKCPCQHCGVNIEFDVEMGGQFVDCPSCNQQTRLIYSGNPNPSKESANPKLKKCDDCGQEISRSADACPHCGLSFKKKHGVFYYVFWTVGSLALIWVLFIVGSLLITVISIGFVTAQNAKQHHIAAVTNSLPAELDIERQKSDYKTNVVIYDFTANYHESRSDGRLPGVEFKLKNNGSKTLKEVEVTVYFRDYLGKNISEEKYHPVLVNSFTSGNKLKPGYIWQMEPGHFYAAKNVPNEWKEGNAEIQVTDLEFENTEP